MAKKTGIDALTPAINRILKDYCGEVEESVQKTIKSITRQGARAVREEAMKTFGTKGGKYTYAKGWTSRTETGKHSAQGIIYNEDVPRLPHLLEYGHDIKWYDGYALRDGGRVSGRPHIIPVEEKLADQLEREVINNL